MLLRIHAHRGCCVATAGRRLLSPTAFCLIPLDAHAKSIRESHITINKRDESFEIATRSLSMIMPYSVALITA